MSTGIEWTDETWNPVTGCDQVSPGCDNCYALTLAKRLKAMGSPRYQNDGDPRTSGPGFGLTLHPDKLDEPLRWRKPRRVFVNSMSDLFHPDVPAEFIADVFQVMRNTPQHTYQILTKRPQRMKGLVSAMYAGWDEVLSNVWLGTSVENQQYAFRIKYLIETPAVVRFLSVEPMIGPVDLSEWLYAHGPWNVTEYGTECSCGAPIVDHQRDLCNGDRLHWVIVGGESGPNARPMNFEWVRDIRDQCEEAGVALFIKQLGSRWGSDHHDIEGFPEDLRVREYPEGVPA